MGAAEVRFEVTEATRGTFSLGAYLQDLFRPKFGGGFGSYTARRGPSVIAENRRGEQFVVAVTTTMEEAHARATVIEADCRRLSTVDWCSQYHVPVSFVTG